MTTITVTARDPNIRKFGVAQIWQANSRSEQQRFRENDGSTITFRLAPGVYEVRLQVLDKKFILGTQRFERGTTFRYSDFDLPSPEFFSDGEFIEVPGGAFTRGSEEFKNTSPAHEISVSAFRIRSIPVTACEYASYLAAGKYAQADDVEICSGQEALKPAVYVNWESAKKFCNWLSSFRKQSFRLPTEAEYERAMRIARTASKYPWGDGEYDPEKPRVPLANYGEYWRGGTRPDRTPVRFFPATRGIYDIAGNVWEWTSDWYDPEFYSKPEAKLQDSRGPTESALHEVVVRGGSFEDPIYKLACAFRGGIDPAIGYYNVGFRVVK
jgi:formylglycine-generating enzyme